MTDSKKDQVVDLSVPPVIVATELEGSGGAPGAPLDPIVLIIEPKQWTVSSIREAVPPKSMSTMDKAKEPKL